MTGDFDAYQKWLGIAPSEQPPNHYRLLGVSLFEPDADIIAGGADARMTHLECFCTSQYAERSQLLLNEIAAAKECLLDPVRRPQYDHDLRSQLDQSASDRLSECSDHRSKSDLDWLCTSRVLSTRVSRSSLPCSQKTRRNSGYWTWVAAVWGGILLFGATMFVMSQQPPARQTAHGGSANKGKSASKNVSNHFTFTTGTVSSVPLGQTSKPPSKPGSDDDADNSLAHDAQQPGDASDETGGAKRAPPEPPALFEKGERAGGTIDADLAREGKVNIELASGAMLTEAILDVPKNWQKALFPEDASVFVAKYPNGELQGVFSLKKAKLHGAAASLHETGRLQTLAFFDDAKRNGPLRSWDRNGKRVCYAEYKNGKKSGVVCLFKDGFPWLIEEWKWQDQKTVQSVYLVRWAADVPRIAAILRINEADNADYRDASKKLAEVTEKLDKGEVDLKKQLWEWSQEEKSRERQGAFFQVNPIRNQNAKAKRDARNLQDNEAGQAFWRSALQRSGF